MSDETGASGEGCRDLVNWFLKVCAVGFGLLILALIIYSLWNRQPQ